MNALNFCYHLQGFLEIGNPKVINEKELTEIKNHLNLVLHSVVGNIKGEAVGNGIKYELLPFRDSNISGKYTNPGMLTYC